MARGAASSVLSAVIVISALDGESERERESRAAQVGTRIKEVRESV